LAAVVVWALQTDPQLHYSPRPICLYLSLCVSLSLSLSFCATRPPAGGVEAAVLVRLHHVALPLWTVSCAAAVVASCCRRCCCRRWWRCCRCCGLSTTGGRRRRCGCFLHRCCLLSVVHLLHQRLRQRLLLLLPLLLLWCRRLCCLSLPGLAAGTAKATTLGRAKKKKKAQVRSRSLYLSSLFSLLSSPLSFALSRRLIYVVNRVDFRRVQWHAPVTTASGRVWVAEMSTTLVDPQFTMQTDCPFQTPCGHVFAERKLGRPGP
jgi:hypothetical protein